MKFSIIIPAYNSANYIRKALDSIKNQSFKDYQLIVICDSCTDNTEEIAKQYGAITETVNYHTDGLTRNRGLELATGDWILFMDDDDWWLHEYVLQQLSDKIDELETKSIQVDLICFSFVFKHVGYAKPIRTCNNMHWPAAWCKCYRREIANLSKFSAVTNGSSDMQFFHILFSYPLNIYNWDMPLYYYNYWRDDSISEKYTIDLRGKTQIL